jgi:hypothetical protein
LDFGLTHDGAVLRRFLRRINRVRGMAAKRFAAYDVGTALRQGNDMRARYFLLLASAILASGTAIAARPLLMSKSAVPLHRIVHASRAQTLYDQMGSDSGNGINSQNFEEQYDVYDDEAADDFILPDGVRWKITEVDMAGYYNEGPADFMTVTFYKNRNGRPGKLVKQFTVVAPDTGGNGSFPIDLEGSVTLKPGHYWVSIVADQRFDFAGQWSWAVSDDLINSPAMWRNPGAGFQLGCTKWTVVTTCVDYIKGDYLFALKGKVR